MRDSIKSIRPLERGKHVSPDAPEWARPALEKIYAPLQQGKGSVATHAANDAITGLQWLKKDGWFQQRDEFFDPFDDMLNRRLDMWSKDNFSKMRVGQAAADAPWHITDETISPTTGEDELAAAIGVKPGQVVGEVPSSVKPERARENYQQKKFQEARPGIEDDFYKEHPFFSPMPDGQKARNTQMSEYWGQIDDMLTNDALGNPLQYLYGMHAKWKAHRMYDDFGRQAREMSPTQGQEAWEHHGKRSRVLLHSLNDQTEEVCRQYV